MTPIGRLAIVTGTGTGIGKTHVSVALLLALRSYFERVTGVKPVETGLNEAHLSDSAQLERASSFHVQHSGYLFAEGVSPHLAAREAGERIDVRLVTDLVANIRRQSDFTLVELAGGLFTPLSDFALNADLVAALEPDATLLITSDRLGVLHEVIAASRAAQAMNLPIDAVVLVAPERDDASTGRNVLELRRFVRAPFLVSVPRRSTEALATDSTIRSIAEYLSR